MIVCCGCDNCAWLFRFMTFFGEMSHNSAVITFLTHFRAILAMIMARTLSTISTNVGVLVVLWNSWIASQVFSLLLVVRVAIASLEVDNDIYWLSVSVYVLIDLLLNLSSHLHVDCNFKSFFWRHRLFKKFLLGVIIRHVENECVSN